MQVGQICNRNVVVTDATAEIIGAAQLMREHHVGTLVVVTRDDGGLRPVGILTDRDIVVEAVAESAVLGRMLVGDIMRRDIAVSKETDDLSETMDRMRNKGVRRMPVTDASGALVGILALDDILEVLGGMVGRLSQLSERQRKLEKSGRPWPPRYTEPTLTPL